MIGNLLVAQENQQLIEQEESAEVFLEEYTDEFQETFFEALKQKGIQNYDRASNLLLECKSLKPDDSTIDHELAKVNLLDKKYVAAEQYGIEALISEPENFWYLDTLNTILELQGNTLDMIKGNIPFDNPALQENLAKIYFQSKRYEAALQIVKGLKKTENTENLLLKINDSLEKIKSDSIERPIADKEAEEDSNEPNPVDKVKMNLESSILSMDYESVYKLAGEAVEDYPLQPYFYYALGMAHNKMGNHNQAIETLEAGLDYLFDDQKLSNRFFEELATAYRALGNSLKANEYLAKVKTGS